MAQDREQPDKENEISEDKLRNGQPVVKTTIELDRELYIRMKEEVARSHCSIREFVSRAAIDKLIKNEPDAKIEPELEQNVLLNNPFAIKLLAILEREVPPPFSIALLLTKLNKTGIEPEDFSAAYLSETFVKELVRSVDFLSGPDAATAIRNAVLDLRGD